MRQAGHSDRRTVGKRGWSSWASRPHCWSSEMLAPELPTVNPTNGTSTASGFGPPMRENGGVVHRRGFAAHPRSVPSRLIEPSPSGGRGRKTTDRPFEVSALGPKASKNRTCLPINHTARVELRKDGLHAVSERIACHLMGLIEIIAAQCRGENCEEGTQDDGGGSRRWIGGSLPQDSTVPSVRSVERLKQ